MIPAARDAWITALENYGTMSLGDCAAAAIRFASAGFPMYGLMSDMIAMHAADYARWPSSAAVYLPNGRPPWRGEIFVQADLGRTLRAVTRSSTGPSSLGAPAPCACCAQIGPKA